MKKVIGFFEEILPDGTIKRSTNRILSVVFGLAALVYLTFAVIEYYATRAELISMLALKHITPEMFKIIMLEIKVIDMGIFVLMVIAAFVPKVIQKFAENKWSGK